MDNDLYRRYRFFKANAGYVVGERAKCALDLARAERLGETYGLSVDWDWDEYPDLSWCECEGRGEEECVRCGERMYFGEDCVSPDGHEYHNHEVLVASVRTVTACNHAVIASLGGIVDALGTPYQRVVEAELLAEAIAEINRNEYVLPVA